MGQSANGDSGISIESVMNDKVVTVGDHANTLPSLYADPTGTEINKFKVSPTGGIVLVKSAIPSYTPIDNSADFHGGSFSIAALNKFNIDSANGGINLTTGGNISIVSGGLVGILSTSEVGVSAELVKINCANTTVLKGPLLYVDTNETVFNKNVSFGNNVMVNGGLAVNGELIARHITTMRSMGVTTSEVIALKGIPIGGAGFNVILVSPIPELNGPALIKILPGNMEPIVSTQPHFHLFDQPAISYLDGPKPLFEEMEAAQGANPIEAKPNIPYDLTLDGLKDKIISRVTDEILEFVTNLIGI